MFVDGRKSEPSFLPPMFDLNINFEPHFFPAVLVFNILAE